MTAQVFLVGVGGSPAIVPSQLDNLTPRTSCPLLVSPSTRNTLTNLRNQSHHSNDGEEIWKSGEKNTYLIFINFDIPPNYYGL